MRILHLTHHSGCKIAIEFMCQKLGYHLETQMADWNYNMSESLASEIWNKYSDYYNSFDCIITSDTSSLARIFLQHNFSNKLVIWVCNRFDYSDQATNNCGFPDNKFYDLFNNAVLRENVRIVSYTKFEYEYALNYKGINFGDEIIRPCSEILDPQVSDSFISGQKKSDTFFITRYHNDNILLDLKSVCDSFSIPNYRGEYNGPGDLIGVKGIIHIPYAWSNLALFENWSLGNFYMIPTKRFLLDLAKSPMFFWSPPFDIGKIDSSEWYLPDHENLFLYFDSFEHLKDLSQRDDLIQNVKSRIADFYPGFKDGVLSKWKKLIED
jgi:hypothetical protein